MPNFLIVMWYICYCYIIAGLSLGALMYLKNKTLQNVHLSSFIQLLKKVQVYPLYLYPFRNLQHEVTTFGGFYDLAQIFI